MSVLYDKTLETITIHTSRSTYQMKIGPYGILLHIYYGPRIESCDMSYLIRTDDVGFSPSLSDAGNDRTYSLDTLPQELSGFNMGDYRPAGIQLEFEDRSCAADLRYVSHEVCSGKYALSGLPAMYEGDEKAETLKVVLKDKVKPVYVTLYYGVFESYDIITRACTVHNQGGETIKLKKIVSASLDFHTMAMDMLTFYGRHAMERQYQRSALTHGTFSIGSTRGTSSHQYNPFTILCSHDAGEDYGHCYGFAFVYSGNFLIEAEGTQRDTLRLNIGIHPEQFEFTLNPNESFTAPEVIMCFSDSGLTPMSNKLHRAMRRNLCRGKYMRERRPVLINNWEATYFDFDGQKLIEIAKAASELGIEMLVMDDGWFGKRDSDMSGLGDWYVNEEKLKMPLKALGREIQSLGMKLGIWFEPEMVSEDSHLYRTHPDWAVKLPGRAPNRGRFQLVLDMSREDVRSYLYESLCAILDTGVISYVKWDMNRSLSDIYFNALPPNRQGEACHRYVLGLYALLEKFTARYPDILFEGCSGGGGRFDAGMLYYCPQIWCSDNTDAIDRLKIQYGTSFAYPISAVGSHVSAVPNHQTGRITPLETRGVTAMAGTFGYELDISLMNAEEKNAVREQVKTYKRHYELITNGNYYRLSSPFDEAGLTAWQFVSADRQTALVHAVMTKPSANPSPQFVRLKGLDENKMYKIEGSTDILPGSALMHAGLLLPVQQKDYQSVQVYLSEQ